MDFFETFLGNAVEMLLWVQNATGFPEWINRHGWVWPIGETLHFVGLCLLIGAVGLFDLRLIGVAKGLPFAALQRLIPWGVLGFLISLSTGVMFVLGNGFAPGEYLRNIAFFWKMLFIVLAGINVLVFYISGTARAVEPLGPAEDAPLRAKVIGAVSLCLWVGVIFFGRMLPIIGDAF
jgi:hypothetical protein